MTQIYGGLLAVIGILGAIALIGLIAWQRRERQTVDREDTELMVTAEIPEEDRRSL